MAGRAVVLRITPTTSEPIEPMRTERRGPRRDVEVRPLGSPERFCPCVILVMDQLSKTKSTPLPTHTQQFVNLIAVLRLPDISEPSTRNSCYLDGVRPEFSRAKSATRSRS